MEQVLAGESPLRIVNLKTIVTWCFRISQTSFRHNAKLFLQVYKSLF